MNPHISDFEIIAIITVFVIVICGLYHFIKNINDKDKFA